MAKERKASVIYEGNASQFVYAFPFDYLRKKFVKVEDIYTNITELTIGVDYTVEDKQVRLVKGIPLGHSVKIYRETTTAPLVEWQDASVLRSADLSLQEVQLLHLAEETADKVFDSGMSTAYDNPNCWDGQYKRIINALDPIEDGDVVTLRYIKANQDSLLNQLKNTGATQNSSIVATGDTQNARLTATGDTQNKRITDTGNAYVSTMTTLKDAATIKANDASNSAELSKRWAMSSSSPDGVSGNKSAKAWAEEAKKWDLTQSPSIVDILYPVGTVYMSADNSKTKADFPFMKFGTWKEVPANLCVQTGVASEAGTQRSAGLPNITGHFAVPYAGGYGLFITKTDPNGMVKGGENRGDGFTHLDTGAASGTGWKSFDTLMLDASLSNPIYGSSTTVQPPAYIVRAWVRTA